MVKVVEPDKIPITSLSQLHSEFSSLQLQLNKEETEHTWEHIDKALKRFHAVVRGGVTKDWTEEFLKGMREKDLVKGVVRSLITERTRLSGTTLDLLASCTRLGSHFAPLLSPYLPALLRLFCRTNKLYISRAFTTLSKIIRETKLVDILKYIVVEWKLESGKSSSFREKASEALAVMLGVGAEDMVLDKETMERRMEELEWIIKTGATDREAKVRGEIKKCWEVYKKVWPERVNHFTAPMTPVIRRYLNIAAGAPTAAPPGGHSSSLSSSTRGPVKKPKVPSSLSSSVSASSAPHPPAPKPSTSSHSLSSSTSSRHAISSLSTSTSKPPVPTAQHPFRGAASTTSSRAALPPLPNGPITKESVKQHLLATKAAAASASSSSRPAIAASHSGTDLRGSTSASSSRSASRAEDHAPPPPVPTASAPSSSFKPSSSLKSSVGASASRSTGAMRTGAGTGPFKPSATRPIVVSHSSGEPPRKAQRVAVQPASTTATPSGEGETGGKKALLSRSISSSQGVSRPPRPAPAPVRSTAPPTTTTTSGGSAPFRPKHAPHAPAAGASHSTTRPINITSVPFPIATTIPLPPSPEPIVDEPSTTKLRTEEEEAELSRLVGLVERGGVAEEEEEESQLGVNVVREVGHDSEMMLLESQTVEEERSSVEEREEVRSIRLVERVEEEETEEKERIELEVEDQVEEGQQEAEIQSKVKVEAEEEQIVEDTAPFVVKEEEETSQPIVEEQQAVVEPVAEPTISPSEVVPVAEELAPLPLESFVPTLDSSSIPTDPTPPTDIASPIPIPDSASPPLQLLASLTFEDQDTSQLLDNVAPSTLVSSTPLAARFVDLNLEKQHDEQVASAPGSPTFASLQPDEQDEPTHVLQPAFEEEEEEELDFAQTCSIVMETPPRLLGAIKFPGQSRPTLEGLVAWDRRAGPVPVTSVEMEVEEEEEEEVRAPVFLPDETSVEEEEDSFADSEVAEEEDQEEELPSGREFDVPLNDASMFDDDDATEEHQAPSPTNSTGADPTANLNVDEFAPTVIISPQTSSFNDRIIAHDDSSEDEEGGFELEEPAGELVFHDESGSSDGGGDEEKVDEVEEEPTVEAVKEEEVEEEVAEEPEPILRRSLRSRVVTVDLSKSLGRSTRSVSREVLSEVQ